MTTVLTYLDGYCERAGDPALWAEPLNAVTNLFFILAAVLGARMLLRLSPSPRRGEAGWGALRPESSPVTSEQVCPPPNLPPAGGGTIDLWLLIAALFAIGVGSGIWHMVPSGATVLMDVIPITLFIHIYLIATMRRLLQLSWARTVGWWALYFGASIAAQIALPPDLLNGTIMYIPTYFTLALLALAVRKKDAAAGRVFFQMLLLWTVSLTFRTVDREVCALLPVGTHFLWHTLNALMLYRLLVVLIARHNRLPSATGA